MVIPHRPERIEMTSFSERSVASCFGRVKTVNPLFYFVSILWNTSACSPLFTAACSQSSSNRVAEKSRQMGNLSFFEGVEGNIKNWRHSINKREEDQLVFPQHSIIQPKNKIVSNEAINVFFKELKCRNIAYLWHPLFYLRNQVLGNLISRARLKVRRVQNNSAEN